MLRSIELRFLRDATKDIRIDPLVRHELAESLQRLNSLK